MLNSLRVAIVSFFFSLTLQAQLSPGKLAQAHAELEGLSQCATCHNLGSSDFAAKCLTCHKALAERIKLGKGLHAGADYRTCQTCHSDHHGLAYALVHWPKGKNAFDHGETGYSLEGGHKSLECTACHKEKNPSGALASEQRRVPKHSLLGLQRDCLTCHEDTHRQQLGSDCLNCHAMTGWKPAKNFDHDKSDFALKGTHTKLDCSACHPKRPGDAAVTQFKPLAHGRCGDCHKDVHQASLGDRCESCHTLDHFKPAAQFDHGRTQFPLMGRHSQVSCEACHPKSSDPARILFSHKAQSSIKQCQSCHKDPHENRLGQNCESCHTPDDWRRMRSTNFDHQRTRFPLLAKHASVPCAKCHGPSFKTKGFEDCASCHKDVHQGQFKDVQGSCGSCHDEKGFKPTRFNLARHQASRFPLNGAHLATPCFACHKAQGSKGVVPYHFANNSCESCHKDIHLGEANAFMKTKGDCAACHSNSTWKDMHFDHDQTRFALIGAHRLASCNSCHSVIPGKGPQLHGIGMSCASCHQDIHQGQFAAEGATDCASCHSSGSWQSLSFDHGRTRFALDGAHQNLACKACHKPVIINEKPFTRFKPLEPACASCHASTTPPL